ncbi:MAG: hypothetical protein ICV54_31265, partial [Nostoc sp. C3-bin3]|nr:hypothetical protein [Nostoc sp. C3-bin3]
WVVVLMFAFSSWFTGSEIRDIESVIIDNWLKLPSLDSIAELERIDNKFLVAQLERKLRKALES